LQETEWKQVALVEHSIITLYSQQLLSVCCCCCCYYYEADHSPGKANFSHMDVNTRS